MDVLRPPLASPRCCEEVFGYTLAEAQGSDLLTLLEAPAVTTAEGESAARIRSPTEGGDDETTLRAVLHTKLGKVGPGQRRG